MTPPTKPATGTDKETTMTVTITDTIPLGYMIELRRWPSPRRPYRATVRLNGGCIGSTGACSTEASAEHAARKIIDRASK